MRNHSIAIFDFDNAPWLSIENRPSGPCILLRDGQNDRFGPHVTVYAKRSDASRLERAISAFNAEMQREPVAQQQAEAAE